MSELEDHTGYFYSPSARGFFHEAVHSGSIPSDAIPVSDERHAALIGSQNAGMEIVPDDDGNPVPVARTPRDMAEWRAFAAGTVQDLLNATARARMYDSMQTAVSYRGDPNPTYAAEAEVLFNWRSAVWTAAFAILAAVEAGERQMPAPEDFLAELPPMVWP